MGRKETFVVIVGALLLASAHAAAQAPPTKFVTPFKGEASVEMSPPQAKAEGNLVVTTFKVKNTSPGPLVGFKVDEYWYNAKGETVSGSPSFRVPKPFMPGEIVEVTLKSPKAADMSRKITMFAHANGKVKPKQVTKFSS
jgi:hypothetical protein